MTKPIRMELLSSLSLNDLRVLYRNTLAKAEGRFPRTTALRLENRAAPR